VVAGTAKSGPELGLSREVRRFHDVVGALYVVRECSNWGEHDDGTYRLEGVGVAKSNSFPVHSSLIADSYPIGIRARISATITGGARFAGVLSPVLVGGIAAIAGGANRWRWAYLLIGLPVLPLAVLAFRIPKPPRGQYEMLDVLGEVVGDTTKPMPISLEAAFARLNRIRTFRTMVLAFAAMGFGLFTGPVLQNLYLDDHFGLESFGRGPGNDLVPLLTSSIGLLVLLLYFPGGLAQIGYSARDALLGLVERRLGPAPAKQQQGPTNLHQAVGACTRAGRSTRAAGHQHRRQVRRDPRRPGRLHRRPAGGDRRADRHQRRREEHAAERHRRLRAEPGRG
jgi:MFS family permease